MSNSLEPHGLCSPGNSPGQNTGVGEGEGEVAQSCPTLCDPMDYIIHGILQARILEWVAIFSRGLEWVAIPFSRDLPKPGIKPRFPALQVDFLTAEPPWKPTGNMGPIKLKE